MENNTINYIDEIWNILPNIKLTSAMLRLQEFLMLGLKAFPENQAFIGVNSSHKLWVEHIEDTATDLCLIKVVMAFYHEEFKEGLKSKEDRLHYYMGLELIDKDKIKKFLDHLKELADKNEEKLTIKERMIREVDHTSKTILFSKFLRNLIKRKKDT